MFKIRPMYFKTVDNSLNLEINISTKDNVTVMATNHLSYIKEYIKKKLRKRPFMEYDAYYQ